MDLTLEKAVELLRNMVTQADEDTPSEFRTDHFRDALGDSYEFIEAYDNSKK